MLASEMVRAGTLKPRRADGGPPLLAVFLRRRQLGRLGGSISPSAAARLADAIQTQEGYYPGSLAFSNNNPGNLAYAGQPGATPGAGGFARFPSYAAGRSALIDQIELDSIRGTDVNGKPTGTVAELLASWAPPSENDTATYIRNVGASTGYNVNAPLDSLDTYGASIVDSSISFPAGDLSFDDAGSSLPAAPVMTAGFDLAQPIDLSAIGLPSAVPAFVVVGAGLLGLSLLNRFFD